MAESEHQKIRLDPFNQMLVDLSNEITEEKFKAMKNLLYDKIPRRDLERMSDPFDLFAKLRDRGDISENDTQLLDYMLRSVGLSAVFKEILSKYTGSANKDHLDKRQEMADEKLAGTTKEVIGIKETEDQEIKRAEDVYANYKNVDFVGREGYLREILDMLRKQSERVTCVSICGLAGIGKTELALEICARLNYRSYRIDLGKGSSSKEVVHEILSTIEMCVGIDSADLLRILKNWCSSCTKDTMLFIDNADQLVEPDSNTSSEFHDTLSELLQVKNGRLKILITSRYGLAKNRFRSCSFEEIELKPLEVPESVKLLQNLAGVDQVSNREAKDLAIKTGNLPLAIKIIASRLKDGVVTAQDFINRLDPAKKCMMTTLRYGTHEAKPIDKCLQVVFNTLPNRFRIALLKLSVFPSAFDERAAMGVLKTEDLSATKLDILQPLVSLWKVINTEPSVRFENLKFSSINKYSLHPLVRSYLQEVGKDDLQNSFDEAQRDFVKYYDELLRQNAKKVEKNILEAKKFLLESNKTNLDHYLDLMTQLKISPRLENKKDHRTLYSTYLLFEYYLDPDRRINIFERFAEVARASGKTIQYCFFRGFQADSWIPKAYPHKALEILAEPLRLLKDLENQAEANTDNYKLTVATCEYVQGRSLVKIREVGSGIALLEKSLGLQKTLLKQHTYVARSMNAIGHAYYSTDTEKALKFHREAVDVLFRVSKDGTHFDMPTFLLNVGTCCHAKGNQAAERHDSEESERYYNEALSYYDKAIDLEKSMNIYGFFKNCCLFEEQSTDLQRDEAV
ncbi:uncharacterized protein [Ptychodera flava]|uniref:uncharacterized protein n=1 Tax=Ptychodera flava TaxID=63121 RepID=UPI00396A737B